MVKIGQYLPQVIATTKDFFLKYRSKWCSGFPGNSLNYNNIISKFLISLWNLPSGWYQ